MSSSNEEGENQNHLDLPTVSPPTAEDGPHAAAVGEEQSLSPPQHPSTEVAEEEEEVAEDKGACDVDRTVNTFSSCDSFLYYFRLLLLLLLFHSKISSYPPPPSSII
jgi:hypothetical protein